MSYDSEIIDLGHVNMTGTHRGRGRSLEEVTRGLSRGGTRRLRISVPLSGVMNEYKDPISTLSRDAGKG